MKENTDRYLIMGNKSKLIPRDLTDLNNNAESTRIELKPHKALFVNSKMQR